MSREQNDVDLFLFYFNNFEKKPLMSKFNIVVDVTKSKILEVIKSGELNSASIEDVIINAIKVGRGVPNPDFDLADKDLWLIEPTKNTQAEIDSINRVLEYHKSECSNFITEKVRNFISSKIDDAICLGFTVAAGVPAGIVCEAVKSLNDLSEIIKNGLSGSIRDDWDKFFSCIKVGDIERMLNDSMYGISGAITGPMISAPPPPPQSQSPESNYRDTPSHSGRSLGEQRSPDVASGSGHVNINDSPRGPKSTINRDILLNRFAAEKISVTVNVDHPPFMNDYACAIVAAACCKIAIKRIIELKNTVPPPPPPPPPPPRQRPGPEEPRGPRGRDSNH